MTFDLQHESIPNTPCGIMGSIGGNPSRRGNNSSCSCSCRAFKSTQESHVYLHSITFCAADMAKSLCQTDNKVAIRVLRKVG